MGNLIGYYVFGKDDTENEDFFHPNMELQCSVYNLTQATELIDGDTEGWEISPRYEKDDMDVLMMHDGNPND